MKISSCDGARRKIGRTSDVFTPPKLAMQIELPDIEWKELVILSVLVATDLHLHLWLEFLESTQNDLSQIKSAVRRMCSEVISWAF